MSTLIRRSRGSAKARRPAKATAANKCTELGAFGALPPGEDQTILSVWAGGHGAPGPHVSAYGAARRAMPGGAWT